MDDEFVPTRSVKISDVDATHGHGQCGDGRSHAIGEHLQGELRPGVAFPGRRLDLDIVRRNTRDAQQPRIDGAGRRRSVPSSDRNGAAGG